jgi:hypothetical protein
VAQANVRQAKGRGVILYPEWGFVNMKKLFTLVVLLAVLLGLWYLLGNREQARQQADVPGDLIQVDTNSVNRLVLMRHNQPDLVFEKDFDGFWNMTKPVADRANPNMVNQIEQGLAQMKLLNLVSEQSSKFALFEIGDIQAAHVQAYADDELQADLYIGKVTPDRVHVYVRMAGSDNVYTATGGAALSSLRTRDVDTYRSRAIFEIDVNLIDSLDVQSTEATYRLRRSDSVSWQISVKGGAYVEAKGPVAESAVQAFGRMRASGFLPDTLVVDLSKPDLLVTAWQLGTTVDKAELIKVADEQNYWVRVEGKPHVYQVFESVYKTFARDPVENYVATDAS